MEANLYALQREITERSDEDEPLSSSHLRHSPSPSPQQSPSQRPLTTIKLAERIRQRYESYLKQRQLPENHE